MLSDNFISKITSQQIRKTVLIGVIFFQALLGINLNWTDSVHANAASWEMIPATLTPISKSTPDGRQSASPTPSPTIRNDFILYKIQTTDSSIYGIAQKFYGEGSKYSVILAANNITENTKLIPGSMLKIPFTPTPTLTPMVVPSVKSNVASPSSTPTMIPTEKPQITPTPTSSLDDPNVIKQMLSTFATATLMGSTVVCLFLASIVYSRSRRITRQQDMTRRIRPPLRRQ